MKQCEKGIVPDEEIFSDIYFIDNEGKTVYRSYVLGEWITEGYRGKNHSPIDNSFLGYLLYPSKEKLEETVKQLYEKGRWKIRNTPGEKRLEILFKTADLLENYLDEIAEALVYDAGKTYSAARGEVMASIEI
jgi:glyceraldehyde-3-phosphate dehydrogenase [NAD(P)+]